MLPIDPFGSMLVHGRRQCSLTDERGALVGAKRTTFEQIVVDTHDLTGSGADTSPTGAQAVTVVAVQTTEAHLAVRMAAAALYGRGLRFSFTSVILT